MIEAIADFPVLSVDATGRGRTMNLRLTVLHNVTDTRDLPAYDDKGEWAPKGKFQGYDFRCHLMFAYEVNWDDNGWTDADVLDKLFAWDNLGNRPEGCRCRSLSVGDVVQIRRVDGLVSSYACEGVGWSVAALQDVENSLIDGRVPGGLVRK